MLISVYNLNAFQRLYRLYPVLKKKSHNFNKNVKTEKPSFISELVVHGNFMPINDGSSRFVGRLKSAALRVWF